MRLTSNKFSDTGRTERPDFLILYFIRGQRIDRLAFECHEAKLPAPGVRNVFFAASTRSGDTNH
jgi:hypothetical protein